MKNYLEKVIVWKDATGKFYTGRPWETSWSYDPQDAKHYDSTEEAGEEFKSEDEDEVDSKMSGAAFPLKIDTFYNKAE